MADTLKPLPAAGLHIRRVDPSRHKFQAAVSHDGLVLYIPNVPFLVKNFKAWVHRLYNRWRTALWPAPPALAIGGTMAFAAWVLTRPAGSWLRSGYLATAIWNLDTIFLWTQLLPTPLRVAYLSTISAGVVGILLTEYQKRFLRLVLSYQGWLFEEPKKPSLFTKAWLGFIKYCYVKTSRPLLYSYQDSLPRLPVPSLKGTCEKTLISLKPLLPEAEFKDLQEKAAAFQKNEGPTLQRYLHLKSMFSRNYVSDWWLRFVYLRGRGSLLVYSNYAGIADFWPLPTVCENQLGRAASLIRQLITIRQFIAHEEMEPLRAVDVIPMCMSQYQYMFSTTRIPHPDGDYLKQYNAIDSRHIVVLSKGVWYRMNVTDASRRLMSAYEIQTLLRSIAEDESDPPSAHEAQIAALTTENRSVWAEAREIHFHRGENRTSLDIIERAMFAVILDDNRPETLAEESRLILTGDGTNRWCDKSICAVVFANGRCGLHTEHSWGDAPVIGHMMEVVLANENRDLKQGVYQFDSRGYIDRPAGALGKLLPPTRLQWNIGADLQQVIEAATAQAKANIADLDYTAHTFEDLNKGLITKKCKCAPDGFIQMGIQLAYYRLEHRFVPTYEPAMMRLYCDGRTETIRSCSAESCEFARAMDDPSVSEKERLRLLRRATDAHQLRTKYAMAGEQVDRHLFALYVVSRGKDISAPFLEQVIGMPWTLSTSQIPWRMAPKYVYKGVDRDKILVSAGGFGPVDPNGYGICYAFMDDKWLVMHVSSRLSCPTTDSEKMLAALHQAYKDMAALCLSETDP